MLFCLMLFSLNVFADKSLFNAVQLGDLEKVQARLSSDPALIAAKQGKWNWSLAHIAAKNNKVRILEFLAEKGLDLNTIDSGGWTALHVAAWFGKYEAAKSLITHNATMIRNDEGHTPYFYALERNYPNIAQLFVQRSFGSRFTRL
ncbi:MAG: ankyrin repeat domain-containing protein [bacterium]|nr:ankyrin repeat domain-containing protein [bacterium]